MIPKNRPLAVSTPAQSHAPSGAPKRPASSMLGVSASRQESWILPGSYVLDVRRVTEGVTRKKEDNFLISACVVRRLSDEGNEENTTVSRMMMLKNDGARPEIRAFLEALLTESEYEKLDDGSPSGDFWADGSDMSVSDTLYLSCLDSAGSPTRLRGRLIHAKAEVITTKKGDPFTKVSWFRAPPLDAE